MCRNGPPAVAALNADIQLRLGWNSLLSHHPQTAGPAAFCVVILFFVWRGCKQWRLYKQKREEECGGQCADGEPQVRACVSRVAVK